MQIFVRLIAPILLTLDTIDIIYLMYSNIRAYKIIYRIRKEILSIFIYYFACPEN